METSGTGRPKRTRRTSTRSVSSNIEVGFVDGRVTLRDSKDPDGPVLRFTPVEWEAFVGGVRLGEFELSPLAKTSETYDRLPGSTSSFA